MLNAELARLRQLISERHAAEVISKPKKVVVPVVAEEGGKKEKSVLS